MAPNELHLVKSHAKEEGVPGTVNLQLAEGDDAAFGQALFPVPANDPNDPLQWPKWKKMSILVLISLYSFLSNTACLGPSVYIEVFAEEFGISPTKASELISYPTLVYGLGTLVLVPLYLKIGRRPVLLLSLLVYVLGLVGCAVSTSFGGLMAGRIVHTFFSVVCEALPVQLINDIFFPVHERGTRIGVYTVCLCWGSTGPLYAGYMLAGGYSWRLFFYVEIAFGGLLLILAFFFVEETAYKRDLNIDSPAHGRKVFGQEEVEKEDGPSDHMEVQTLVPPRKSFFQTLKPWSAIDLDENMLQTAALSFTYFLIPSVFWVISSYGIYIGLGALVFNYTFPIKIVAPPYNWAQQNAGLIALGNLVGYALAVPFTVTSDRLAARLTKRNNGIRESEMRLGVLLPAMLIAPAGLVVYGLTAEMDLHWFGYFAGVAMTDWGSYFFFSFTLAYAVDSYNANTSQMLIAMCVGKQIISFSFGLYLLDWVLESGYVVIVAVVFMVVLLLNNVQVITFMIFGKRLRVAYHDTWLSRLHQKSINGPQMTH